METGRFGLKLSFYAVLGFILAFLGQTFLCGLLLGFVILVEKNNWLTKQMIQAFLLTIVSSIVHSVLSILDIFEAIPFLGVVSVSYTHLDVYKRQMHGSWYNSDALLQFRPKWGSERSPICCCPWETDSGTQDVYKRQAADPPESIPCSCPGRPRRR